MVTVVRRHPLLAYFLLTFAISWGGFVLVVGPGALVTSNWRAEGVFPGAVLAMLAGPSIAGLLLTGIVDGRGGYRALLASLGRWRAGAGWYALAILLAPMVAAGVLAALSVPAPIVNGGGMGVLVGGLAAGATTILEEIGWTGFAVPRLRRRHGVAATGLIVGSLWGIWHLLQQVFISGTYAGDVAWPVFLALSASAAIASLTAYRILMVWLYDHTGSLFVTTLMHGMLTASTIFWFTADATGGLFLADVWLVAAALWVGVGAVALAEGWIAPRSSWRAATPGEIR